MREDKINTTQLAALRRAAESDTGRIHGVDRTTLKALRDRGLAVELDANGRHVFDSPVYGEVVYETVDAGETQLGRPYEQTRFYITPAGRRRAERAADLVGTTADGRPVDPSLMEDL